jgi:general secretion pathway protein L
VAAGNMTSGPAGVWTLSGDALVASDVDGPATVLVPSEAVRLLAVDLPVAGQAKRLAALPFAVEDMIAEPLDAVHLALGEEIAPKRFLVGVVRHDRMAEWIARVEEAGLEHAAVVPDALALPRPVEGEWAVDLGLTRAVVRSGDGTGFAIPTALLLTAWQTAGRPRATSYGLPMPAEMRGDIASLGADPLSRRVLAPALDLRQGRYARRRRALPGVGKRLAQLAAVAAIAHAGIAAADTIMLRSIANQREAETRELVQSLSPGTQLPADGIAPVVADLIPPAQAGGGGNAFLAAAARVSTALAPLGPSIRARSMSFAGGSLTMAVDADDPATAAPRIQSALRDAGVQATVSATAAEGILIVANVA